MAPRVGATARVYPVGFIFVPRQAERIHGVLVAMVDRMPSRASGRIGSENDRSPPDHVSIIGSSGIAFNVNDSVRIGPVGSRRADNPSRFRTTDHAGTGIPDRLRKGFGTLSGRSGNRQPAETRPLKKLSDSDEFLPILARDILSTTSYLIILTGLNHNQREPQARESVQMTPNRFVAFDLETADSKQRRICQIGAVLFEDGRILKEWSENIDPEVPFDPHNTRKHRLTESDCVGCRTFADIYDDLMSFVHNQYVSTHSAFDYATIRRICEDFGFEIPECRIIDTCKIAKSVLRLASHALPCVAQVIGHNMEKHHHALHDAVASGRIAIAFSERIGCSIQELHRYNSFIQFKWKPPQKLEHENGKSFLEGKTFVFTGKFAHANRGWLKKHVSELGAKVPESVSGKTSALITGCDPGPSKLAKAQRLGTTILSEECFLEQIGIPVDDIWII